MPHRADPLDQLDRDRILDRGQGLALSPMQRRGEKADMQGNRNGDARPGRMPPAGPEGIGEDDRGDGNRRAMGRQVIERGDIDGRALGAILMSQSRFLAVSLKTASAYAPHHSGHPSYDTGQFT